MKTFENQAANQTSKLGNSGANMTHMRAAIAKTNVSAFHQSLGVLDYSRPVLLEKTLISDDKLVLNFDAMLLAMSNITVESFNNEPILTKLVETTLDTKGHYLRSMRLSEANTTSQLYFRLSVYPIAQILYVEAFGFHPDSEEELENLCYDFKLFKINKKGQIYAEEEGYKLGDIMNKYPRSLYMLNPGAF